MNTYMITEKQSVESIRDGFCINSASLKDAKTKATKSQLFYGTVLTIEENGALIAYKKDGVWNDL